MGSIDSLAVVLTWWWLMIVERVVAVVPLSVSVVADLIVVL